jgi:hypothetical protein
MPLPLGHVLQAAPLSTGQPIRRYLDGKNICILVFAFPISANQQPPFPSSTKETFPQIEPAEAAHSIIHFKFTHSQDITPAMHRYHPGIQLKLNETR